MSSEDDFPHTNNAKSNEFVPGNHVLWPFLCRFVQRFHQQIDVFLDERLLFSHSLLIKCVRKYSTHPTMLDVAHNGKNAFNSKNGSD